MNGDWPFEIAGLGIVCQDKKQPNRVTANVSKLPELIYTQTK
jgi:hypothetical protein